MEDTVTTSQEENLFLSFDKEVEKTEVIGRWTTLIAGTFFNYEI